MTDNPNKKTFWDKVHLDPTMLLILLALLVYSALVIWSASGQDIGMMERKIGQIAMGLVIMVVMAQIPPRVYEGWAPYLYIICIILLVAVDAFGAISKGAQRWLDLGIVRFQPSEIAKIAVPLMVARFINRDVCPPSLKNTGIALVLIFMPTLLVAAQPDLGTSILVALSGLFVLFLSGLSWRLIGVAVVLVAAFIPILWFFLMHDYQRQRVMMLLDPESDPLGAGYHIIQSKIAIGSGGLRGKGWLHKRAAFDNLFTSMRYLGFALAGSPYMGIGRNLAYRKELFYQQKGFSAHLNLQRGDDDLFINHVATPENTRVETDANAIVRMQPLLRTKDWKEEKIGYASTARLYHGMQRWLAGFETLTRLAFHASWIAAMVIGILHFHWLAAGVAFLLFLLRFTMQAVIVNKTARDLEEQRRYYFTLPAFDLLQPIQSLRWKWYCLFRKKSGFLRK